MPKSRTGFKPLQLVLLFLGVLLLGIIFRRVAFLFFILVTIAVFIGSIYYIFKLVKESKKAKEFQNSMEGSIVNNLKLCEEQISKNQLEMLDIQKNIEELQEKLTDKNEVNENSVKESDLLISGFERELDLRKAKLDFYKICKEKLQNIDFNQKLSDEIASKKEKLKQLQEEHFDDLAEMEQLRSDMEYNKSYIDTINHLSIRMAESTSLSTAQELHNELKLITDELKDI